MTSLITWESLLHKPGAKPVFHMTLPGLHEASSGFTETSRTSVPEQSTLRRHFESLQSSDCEAMFTNTL